MRVLKRPYCWYAIYTKSRTEKKIFEELCTRNIECYLPLRRVLRQWSDRKKWVEEPLLRSYLFVRISEREYYDVLNVSGAVRYVSFGGKAVPIPEKQIDALKVFLHDFNRCVEFTYEDLKVGNFVEIISGSLKGVQGEILQFRGKRRIVLRFKSLGCCVYTNVLLKEVRLIGDYQ